jgi:hypothetical protein
VKHLLKDQTHAGVVAKCGARCAREDATVWYSDVDCPKCRPYDWVPDPRGHGLMQVERGVKPTKTKVMKRLPRPS